MIAVELAKAEARAHILEGLRKAIDNLDEVIVELKDLIEKLFVGYREIFSDSKKVLDKYSIGLAHNKVIHLLSMYEGISISELLKRLKVTKQSLNRVLKDLIKLVANFYNIDPERICDKTRRKEIVKPRQIAMYILRAIQYAFLTKKR